MMSSIKKFLHKYSHIWLLSYVFIYLPWFFYLEKEVKRGFHVMHVSLDDYIPFCEYFIIPYLLWFIYVAGTVLYFMLTSKEDYYRLCTFLFTGMTICLIICTFYHNGTNLRPSLDPDKNIFSALVAWLYQTDTSTNVFPSIHVYNSIATHIGIVKSERLRRHPWVGRASLVLMTLICLSTVFLKQHSVIDGVGAAVMAYVMYWLVYGYGLASQDKKVQEKALS